MAQPVPPYHRPFLKWAGNKYRLLENILKILPTGSRLIEPFAGAAAVFLNTKYDEYILSDLNIDLIHLYQLIKSDHQELILCAKRYFTSKNNEAHRYYHLRDQFNAETDRVKRSALFIYLNRHGYNGLCRYNQKRLYNVPFGRYRNPYFPEKEILHFQKKLKRTKLLCSDFESILKKAKKGDVIYCDPPYVPLTKTSYFTNYSETSFTLESQERLANTILEVVEKGAIALVSNHDTPLTRTLYQRAQITSFQVARQISCKPQARRPVRELLALFETCL